MKTLSRLAIAAILTAIAAHPAAAQSADVRVRVDTQAVRQATQELREVLQELLGPETRLELQRELRGLSRELAAALSDVGRDLSRELGRDWSREFRGWGDAWGGWAEQRDFRASQNDTERRNFTIGPSGELDLENISGNIQVQAGPGRELIIEIRRHARGRTEADARTGLTRVRVETVQRGNRVTARTQYPNERQSSYGVSVDYIVTAPAGTRVTVNTLSGDVSVSGIQGETSATSLSGDMTAVDVPRLVSAKTTSGDVTLRNVGEDGGQVSAATTSGSVEGTGLRGRRLDLSSVSGDVTVRDVQAGDVKLGSISGDLIFDGRLQTAGRYTFTSHSGDVRLAIDERTGFTLEASTQSGTTRTDIPLQVTRFGEGRRASRQLRGTFGDGAAVVSATSFSGDIVIVRR